MATPSNRGDENVSYLSLSCTYFLFCTRNADDGYHLGSLLRNSRQAHATGEPYGLAVCVYEPSAAVHFTYLGVDRARAEQMIIRGPGGSDDPCTWLGVNCQNGLIDVISREHPYKQIRKFDPKWLPPTLGMVNLSTQQSGHTFETQFLPKRIKFVSMVECWFLPVELDLTVLPQSLYMLELSRNSFYGTVHLTSVPPELRKLLLDFNSFDLLVVCNGALPGIIQKYSIRFQHNNHGMKVICLDEKHVRQAIMYYYEVPQ
ncbi:vacuolar iron family transporter [Perkinsela sp. CCAP 1560/4]|nr:vacuolar iron family transporter [Perkinsela sp. CCAP 1560/4]|eukprot:KNH08197.1 vacuolar iron family transporter [Perkinsela sp. CCAP 1560/4]